MTQTATRRARKRARPPIEATLSLGDWGPRGSVTATLDGEAVLVDLGIPGEEVVASVDRRKKPWHGIVESVSRQSPQRVHPACAYFMAGCGGCQIQHLDYASQLRSKQDTVNGHMASAGVSHRVDRVRGMDDPWRYRHTAAIAIGWEAGFRPRRRRGILEIHDCLISHPLIGDLAHAVNGLLDQSKLPNYHGKAWLDCAVVGTRHEPGLQVVIQGITGLSLETHPELTEVARTLIALDSVRSVAFRHREGDVRPLIGDLVGGVELNGRLMRLPAGSFFQTNPGMVSALLERMAAVLADRTIDAAADVYGGVGTFGLALADRVASMHLIELDAAAVDAARLTAAEWGLENVSFTSKHAETALGEIESLDLAIVDPPRSGLGQVVVSALAETGVPLILYISCAPRSLASDLALLQHSGYRVESLDMFDFYPHTYHVESLAVISR